MLLPFIFGLLLGLQEPTVIQKPAPQLEFKVIHKVSDTELSVCIQAFIDAHEVDFNQVTGLTIIQRENEWGRWMGLEIISDKPEYSSWFQSARYPEEITPIQHVNGGMRNIPDYFYGAIISLAKCAPSDVFDPMGSIRKVSVIRKGQSATFAATVVRPDHKDQ